VELDPKGHEQSPGSVGAPGYCCNGIGIIRRPSREGSSPETRTTARGSDAPAFQFRGSAGCAAEA
jgi:hypothetical protein